MARLSSRRMADGELRATDPGPLWPDPVTSIADPASGRGSEQRLTGMPAIWRVAGLNGHPRPGGALGRRRCRRPRRAASASRCCLAASSTFWCVPGLPLAATRRQGAGRTDVAWARQRPSPAACWPSCPLRHRSLLAGAAPAMDPRGAGLIRQVAGERPGPCARAAPPWSMADTARSGPGSPWPGRYRLLPPLPWQQRLAGAPARNWPGRRARLFPGCRVRGADDVPWTSWSLCRPEAMAAGARGFSQRALQRRRRRACSSAAGSVPVFFVFLRRASCDAVRAIWPRACRRRGCAPVERRPSAGWGP